MNGRDGHDSPRPGCNHDVAQEERAEIRLRVLGLGLRQKEHRAARLIETAGQIPRISRDADDLEFTARLRFAAEMLADRIFMWKELSRERLIDDSYLPRSRRILVGDVTSLQDRRAYDLKMDPIHTFAATSDSSSPRLVEPGGDRPEQ